MPMVLGSVSKTDGNLPYDSYPCTFLMASMLADKKPTLLC